MRSTRPLCIAIAVLFVTSGVAGASGALVRSFLPQAAPLAAPPEGGIEIDPAWLPHILSRTPDESPVRIVDGVAYLAIDVQDPIGPVEILERSQEGETEVPLDALVPEGFEPVPPDAADLEDPAGLGPEGDPYRRCWWHTSSSYSCCDYYGPNGAYYTCFRMTYECHYSGRYSQRCAWRYEETAHKCA